jgi:hypothetical protein
LSLELQAGPRIVQGDVNPDTMILKPIEVVDAGHSRRLDHVGLQVADPHHASRRTGERSCHVRQRGGGEHAGEQGTGSQQDKVRLIDRLQRRARDGRALRVKAQPADPGLSQTDRRLAVDQLAVGLGDQ